jgi:hypothetical protein
MPQLRRQPVYAANSTGAAPRQVSRLIAARIESRRLCSGLTIQKGRRHFVAGLFRRRPDVGRIIEIRSYRLKPGSALAFHHIMLTESVPLHKAFGIDLVAHGPSLHEPDTYFLIRAFDDLQDLIQSQKGFYASGAWRSGPREAIVAAIASDAVAVMWVDASAVQALRTATMSGRADR